MNYDNEQWEPIKGYEGLYEISNMGRVKSLSREVKVGRNGTRLVDERILSVFGGKIVYKLANLCKNGKIKSKAVHVLVAEAFLGHIPDGHKMVVDHINGDKHDNRLENLQVISHAENVAKGMKLVCPNCGYKH